MIPNNKQALKMFASYTSTDKGGVPSLAVTPTSGDAARRALAQQLAGAVGSRVVEAVQYVPPNPRVPRPSRPVRSVRDRLRR